MIATLKVLSILLNYPTREVTTAVGELREAIDREALLVGKPRAALDPLLGALDEKDLYELQEDYVFLFDRTKSLSLHLFEPWHHNHPISASLLRYPSNKSHCNHAYIHTPTND